MTSRGMGEDGVRPTFLCLLSFCLVGVGEVSAWLVTAMAESVFDWLLFPSGGFSVFIDNSLWFLGKHEHSRIIFDI